jgi:hypothetical protein
MCPVGFDSSVVSLGNPKGVRILRKSAELRIPEEFRINLGTVFEVFVSEVLEKF